MGAINGHGNARSVARILRSITLGGAVDGVRLLSPDTIGMIFDEQSHVPQRRACYWGGWGGSVILMDFDSRTTISYMMNKMAPGIIGSDRSEDYVRTVYGCLG